jgi:hypothetical protein
LAGAEVFSDRSPRWSGAFRPVAERLSAVPEDASDPDVAVGKDTFAVETALTDPNHFCPCAGQLSAFTASSTGWAATGGLPGSVGVSTNASPHGIALDGRTLASAGDGGVAMFEALLRPVLHGSTVAGLTRGHPVLRVDIDGWPGDGSGESLALSPPDGLRFTRNHRLLARTVHLRGGRVADVSLTDGRLVVTLRRAVRNLTLSVSGAGLIESAALLGAAAAVHAFNRQHRHKHRLPLPAELRVSDADRDTTPFLLDLGVT